MTTVLEAMRVYLEAAGTPGITVRLVDKDEGIDQDVSEFFGQLLDVADAAVRFVRAADEWDAVAHTDAEDANKNSLYRQAAICAHSLLRTALDEVLEDVPA